MNESILIKTMTVEEYFEQMGIDIGDIVCYTTPEGTKPPIDFDPIEMAEKYHKAQLKLLGIGGVVRSVFTIHSTEDESIIKIVGTEEEAKQEVLKFAEEHKYADFFYEKQTL